MGNVRSVESVRICRGHLQGRRVSAAPCPDLDGASKSRTLREAKKMLAEAVTLYLQACFENGFPHLRTAPAAEDPRHHPVENPLEIFPR